MSKKYTNREKLDYFKGRVNNKSLSAGERQYAKERLSALQKPTNAGRSPLKPKPKATMPKLLQKDENGLSAIDYWSDYSGYLSHDTYAEVESTPKKDLRAALPFVKDSTLKYAINYYLNGEKLF